MKVSLKGNEAKLEGKQPELYDKAPQFSLKDLDGQEVSLEKLAGEKILLSVFPDIDTSVCATQTRTFFKKASEYKDLKILNISNNSQEEMRNWCATNGIDSKMLSDKDLEFAKAYGLYIPKFEVLARSVFVIDQNGKIAYREILDEMVNEPDYNAAFKAVEQL